MHARVNIFQGPTEGGADPADIAREQVLPAARQLEGFAGMLVLEDRATGKSMGITFWQTEEALRASEEAAARLRSDSAQAMGDVEVVAVERYEVAFEERT